MKFSSIVFARLLFFALVLGFAASQAVAQSAAETYKSKCQMCHGASGNGDTPMGKKLKAKDFHSPDVQKKSDDELFEITEDGVSKDGKFTMPAYKTKLSDSQIHDLVKYIRELGKK